MTHRKYRYSIIIPTRNREKYLRFSLASVLAMPREDIEIVVSDNHSSDGTAQYLSTISDPRVKMVRPTRELPMAQHYEFALMQASGDWVSILGDDDAVMPYIFDRLDRLTEIYPEISVISSARAYYFWPGCEDLWGNAVVHYDRTPEVRTRSSRVDLLKSLMGLLSCFDLPQIYTSSVVRRSLVEKIRADSGGCFFHSIIPDMYSAVAICLSESSYLRIEEPLFWTGTSSGSMGRSDRIYRDSERDSAESDNFAQLRLHPEVPEAVHILGFGSFYLYEALLNCPFARGFWRSKWIGKLVYADLVRRTRTHWSRADLIDIDAATVVDKQIVALAYVPIELAVMRWLLTMGDAANRIWRLPKRVLRKIRRQFRSDTIVSTNRTEFPTIAAASDAVRRLN